MFFFVMQQLHKTWNIVQSITLYTEFELLANKRSSRICVEQSALDFVMILATAKKFEEILKCV